MEAASEVTGFLPQLSEYDEVIAKFLRGSLLGWFAVGLLHFSAIPVSYVLAHAGYGALAYSFLPIVTALAYLYQKGFWQDFEAFVGELKPGRCRIAEKAHEDLTGPYKILSKPLTCLGKWLGIVLAGLTEFSDPLLDGMTAGSAESLLSPEADRAFSSSWRSGGIFGLGDRIADWGLAATLTWLMVLFTVLQTVAFMYWSLVAWKASGKVLRGEGLKPGRRDVRIALAQAAASCEIASLAFPRAVFQEIHQAIRLEAGFPPDNFSVMMKVFFQVFLENAPSAWLTVSLLGLGVKFGTLDLLQPAGVVTVLSALSSIVLMASPLADLRSKLEFLVCGIPLVLVVLALMAKFIGTMYCATQQDALFGLTELCIDVN